MKKRTCLVRVYHPIIGKEGFYCGIGYFTIKKIYTYKRYSKCAETPDGSRWFREYVVCIETRTGVKYRMPLFSEAFLTSYIGTSEINTILNEYPGFKTRFGKVVW